MMELFQEIGLFSLIETRHLSRLGHVKRIQDDSEKSTGQKSGGRRKRDRPPN